MNKFETHDRHNLFARYVLGFPGLYPRDNQSSSQDSSSQRERTVPVFPTPERPSDYRGLPGLPGITGITGDYRD